MTDLIELLDDLLDYMQDRADASMEPGDTRFHGNKEMDFQGRIESALDVLTKDAPKLKTSQGGECAGLAPPAGCRWPKTCGAQLAEAAVREEGERPAWDGKERRAPLVYHLHAPCERHRHMPWSSTGVATVSAVAIPTQVCPHCEAEKKLKPLEGKV